MLIKKNKILISEISCQNMVDWRFLTVRVTPSSEVDFKYFRGKNGLTWVSGIPETGTEFTAIG